MAGVMGTVTETPPLGLCLRLTPPLPNLIHTPILLPGLTREDAVGHQLQALFEEQGGNGLPSLLFTYPPFVQFPFRDQQA